MSEHPALSGGWVICRPGGVPGPEEIGTLDVQPAQSLPFADTLLGKTVSEEVAAQLAQARKQRGDARAEDITLDALLDRLAAWADAEDSAAAGSTAATAARTGRGVGAFLASLPPALTAFRAGTLVAVAKGAVPARWGAATGIASDPGAVYARVVVPYVPRDRGATAVLRVTCDAGAGGGILDVPLAAVARLPPAVRAQIDAGAADRLVWDREKAARLHAQHTVERSLLAVLRERGGYTPAEEQLLSRVFLSDVPAAAAPVFAALGALQRAEGELRAIEGDAAQLAALAARSRTAAGAVAAGAVGAAAFEAMARDTVRAYLGVLAAMQQHARDVVEGVRTGATKRELTRWYLDLVHREADALLAAHGFAADAVPANYTEQPPACMAAVRRNQQICHALLAGRETLPDVAAALARTCRTVYARLDAFVLDTMQVLRQDMGLAARADSLDDVPAFVAAAQARAASAEAAAEPLARSWRDATRDIEYISEMHRRENMAGGASKDIVPVSGLLLGRLTRIENEMQTVALIWDRPAPADVVTRSAVTSAPERDTGRGAAAPGTPPVPRLDQVQPTQKRSLFRIHKEKRKDTSS